MNYLEKIAARIKAEIPADKLPDADVDELMMSYALLVEAKGTRVTNEDVHDAWSAWMTKIDPSHKSIVPYDELDDETRRQDTMYTDAIRLVAEREQED